MEVEAVVDPDVVLQDPRRAACSADAVFDLCTESASGDLDAAAFSTDMGVVVDWRPHCGDFVRLELDYSSEVRVYVGHVCDLTVPAEPCVDTVAPLRSAELILQHPEIRVGAHGHLALVLASGATVSLWF